MGWIPLALGGAVVLILAVVLGVQFLTGDDPPPITPTVASATDAAATQAAAAASPTVTTPTPSPSVEPTVTLDPVEAKRYYFGLGLEQYANKQWATAADAFEQVFTIDPDYVSVPELRDVLTASLYNQSIVEISRSPNPEIKYVEAIRDRFARIVELIDGASTSALTPQGTYQDRRTHATEWGAILDAYLESRTLIKNKEWDAAIKILKDIPLTRDDYGANVRILDVAAQLVAAYKGYGDQLAAAGNYEEAREQYEQALDLGNASNIDTSSVATAIAALPVPTVTPTPVLPTPIPAKLRVSVANYNDDPTCISLGVSGINTSGWFFSVDGIGLRGNIDAAGNGRLCGLGWKQEVTISIFNASGRLVSGGGGIPSRGSAIMVAVWR